MKFCLSIIILSLIIQILIKPPYKRLYKVYYQWIYDKVYATRTRISIGGLQDRDTLIEQSANYSNRTFTESM